MRPVSSLQSYMWRAVLNFLLRKPTIPVHQKANKAGSRAALGNSVDSLAETKWLSRILMEEVTTPTASSWVSVSADLHHVC